VFDGEIGAVPPKNKTGNLFFRKFVKGQLNI
jgi:hypothetical protein